MLFPEVEVTKSLSKNLLKSRYTFIKPEAVRVIDTNDMVEKKIREVEKQLQNNQKSNQKSNQQSKSADGFVAGLVADEIGVLPEEEVQQEDSELEVEESSLSGEQMSAAYEEMMQNATAEIEKMRQDAMEQIEAEKQEIFESARNSGYEEGLLQGKNDGFAETDKQRKELQEEKKKLEQEYAQILGNLEPELIDTFNQIYQHIFQVDFENKREIVVHLISGTLQRIEGAKTFFVHVGKEDYPFVSMNKKKISTEGSCQSATLEIIEDLSLGQGECFIETDTGIFDCSVDVQLHELSKKLKLLSFQKALE